MDTALAHEESAVMPKKSGMMFAPWILTGIAFLLPVFFVPASAFPFPLTKTVLALVGVVVLYLLFVLRTFRSGSLSLSFSIFYSALFLLPAAYLVSAVFSINPQLSFWGNQLNSDTFGFMALSVSLTAVTLLSLETPKQVFSVLTGLFAAGCAVILFQLMQLLLGTPLPLALFDAPTANLVGTWNGLAVFLGLLVSVGLIALEALQFRQVSSIIIHAALFAAVFLLAVINFATVWILVALVALAVLVYSLTASFTGKAGRDGVRGASAGLVLIIALFFIFMGANTASWLQNSFGVQALEVRPSIDGTVAVMQSVYTTNPVFGTGPNTFANNWLLSRPQPILTTPFWDVQFTAGFAAIPTAAATGGAVVALSWLLVISAFAYAGTRALLVMPGSRDHSYFLVASTAIASAYLLTAHMVYVPEPAMTLLMFLFFGLFLASIRGSAFSREVTITFSKSPRLGFVSVLLMIIVAVVSLAALYGGTSVYASAVKSQEAVEKSVAGNFDGAREDILAALTLSEQDRYYRTLTAVELARLNNLITSGAADAEAQTQFTELFTSAVNASSRALELNQRSYDNWLSRASVYAAVVPLGVQGASESAVEALNTARTYNPGTPEVDFRLAQIRAAEGKASEARALAEAALQKKTDYTPAILFLAEIALNDGRLDDAIRSVETVVVLDPQNAQLLYQLGLLKLQAGEYDQAREALERALAIAPDYANAKFYLGSAYLFLDRAEDALAQFEPLLVGNPENETLRAVIDAAKKGENPFEPTPAESNIETPTE